MKRRMKPLGEFSRIWFFRHDAIFSANFLINQNCFGKFTLERWNGCGCEMQVVAREKLVKKRKREWKFTLIEANNPDWRNLWDEWFPET
jgi:predicted GIY-YIG superfamily endonuclease